MQFRSIGSWDQDCWSASIGEHCAWNWRRGAFRTRSSTRCGSTIVNVCSACTRLDLLVERRVIVELKSVQRLEFVHMAQVLSYLRAAELHVGLLLNFFAAPLAIRRIVL